LAQSRHRLRGLNVCFGGKAGIGAARIALARRKTGSKSKIRKQPPQHEPLTGRFDRNTLHNPPLWSVASCVTRRRWYRASPLQRRKANGMRKAILFIISMAMVAAAAVAGLGPWRQWLRDATAHHGRLDTAPRIPKVAEKCHGRLDRQIFAIKREQKIAIHWT
jgi:hypothetical protein